MEYCNGGDLSGCLKKYKAAYHRPFPEEIVQYIMRQVVEGINFIHSNKIIHRDLKLDNILVNFSSENDKKSLNMMKAVAKIIDFGFATMLQSSKSNLTYTVLGTPAYMDPRLLNNMQKRTPNMTGYDEKADIWSLGALCYEMLVGHVAFSGSSMQELFQKVKQGTYSLPTNVSEEIFSFINGMLQKDPNKRLSASQLLKHDFLVKNVKQFKRIDVNKIPGILLPNGVMNVNSGKDKTGNNLYETVWDIFMQQMKANPQVVNVQRQAGVPGGIYPQRVQQNFYAVPQMAQHNNQYNQYGVMPNMQRGY